jgi:hypothetical protein
MRPYRFALILLVVVATAGRARAALFQDIFDLTVPVDPAKDPKGLSARAVFTFDTDDPTRMIIHLINTSTSLPDDFSSADQLLTGISWDFGKPGLDRTDPRILSGSVVIGPDGYSINFNQVPAQLAAGADVSGEWGYGNKAGTDLLPNFVSTNAAHTTRFPGANLDGTLSLNGPQGGIATYPPLISLGGLGAVTPSIIITVKVDRALTDLDFLRDNGVRVEFGSDAMFLGVPEPGTLTLLALAAVLLPKRRRSA